MGQKRTLKHLHPTSALPPKADIRCRDRHVRFVPKADMDLPLSSRSVEMMVQHDAHDVVGELAAVHHYARYSKPYLRLAFDREVSSASATSGNRKAAGLAAPFPQMCVAIISPSVLRNSALSLGFDRGAGDKGVSDQSPGLDVGRGHRLTRSVDK